MTALASSSQGTKSSALLPCQPVSICPLPPCLASPSFHFHCLPPPSFLHTCSQASASPSALVTVPLLPACVGGRQHMAHAYSAWPQDAVIGTCQATVAHFRKSTGAFTVLLVAGMADFPSRVLAQPSRRSASPVKLLELLCRSRCCPCPSWG